MHCLMFALHVCLMKFLLFSFPSPFFSFFQTWMQNFPYKMHVDRYIPLSLNLFMNLTIFFLCYLRSYCCIVCFPKNLFTRNVDSFSSKFLFVKRYFWQSLCFLFVEIINLLLNLAWIVSLQEIIKPLVIHRSNGCAKLIQLNHRFFIAAMRKKWE